MALVGPLSPSGKCGGPAMPLDVFAVESQQAGLVGQVVQDGLDLVMWSQAPRDCQVEEGLGVLRHKQLLRRPVPLVVTHAPIVTGGRV